jgi:hypothetical protein
MGLSLYHFGQVLTVMPIELKQAPRDRKVDIFSNVPSVLSVSVPNISLSYRCNRSKDHTAGAARKVGRP